MTSSSRPIYAIGVDLGTGSSPGYIVCVRKAPDGTLTVVAERPLTPTSRAADHYQDGWQDGLEAALTLLRPQSEAIAVSLRSVASSIARLEPSYFLEGRTPDSVPLCAASLERAASAVERLETSLHQLKRRGQENTTQEQKQHAAAGGRSIPIS